ncbi:Chaperone surA [Gossypium australe]|uniref:Chaperone surA n=1 Tax=Gossypium australe TaxID=47621 RepID=A0A5B6VX06_9ROSI|nr:Chaperone surA [Gossypium australe]
MSEWFSEFIQTNPAASQPPPPQYRVEEFRAKADDDAERAEFWLENVIRVFDGMSLTFDECIKCAVSLLRDTTYN